MAKRRDIFLPSNSVAVLSLRILSLAKLHEVWTHLVGKSFAIFLFSNFRAKCWQNVERKVAGVLPAVKSVSTRPVASLSRVPFFFFYKRTFTFLREFSLRKAARCHNAP